MLGLRKTTETSTAFQLNRPEKFTRTEKVVLRLMVASLAAFDLFTLLATPDADGRAIFLSLLSIATSLTLALFIRSPLFATIALGCAVTLAFLAGNASAGLAAAAIAAMLVMRVATTPVIVGYVGAFSVGVAAYAYGFGTTTPASPINTALPLVFGTVAGGIGLALRAAQAHGHRLEQELVLQAEHEREAVMAERRWIAGELHDSIAHHLTVIALHVQMLDDESVRPGSQEAIRVAARKALSDLRFVIGLADESTSDSQGSAGNYGDLADAVAEASAEFTAAGHPVALNGDPADERIPRGAELILARIVRESATNVLKYAGPGEVSIGVSFAPGSVELEIRSPLPATPRRDLPSTGTGLNRMAERILGVSGKFSAGPDGDVWLVSATLPMA